MASIEVTPIGSAEFQVIIREESANSVDETTHRVIVPAGYMAELGVEEQAMNRLVHESFRFLLEREPKEAILRSFELSDIETYFPGYSVEIRSRMSSATP